MRRMGSSGEHGVNKTTEAVIGAAIEVHKHLGPGLLESAYERCLCQEFRLRKMQLERQVVLPVTYKGVQLDCGYRIDLVVNDEVIVEIKTVEHLLPIHEAQTLTYMRLGGWQVGLLLNFSVPILIRGIKRLVLGLKE
ncbi:MAG TPA: GxxExxY protein [Burkholderiales bacterium]|nr:GxxExxY protein [Burkholderiales bacterium]